MCGAYDHRHSAAKCKMLTKTFKKHCVFKGTVHGARIFTATYCIGGVASPKPLFFTAKSVCFVHAFFQRLIEVRNSL